MHWRDVLRLLLRHRDFAVLLLLPQLMIGSVSWQTVRPLWVASVLVLLAPIAGGPALLMTTALVSAASGLAAP